MKDYKDRLIEAHRKVYVGIELTENDKLAIGFLILWITGDKMWDVLTIDGPIFLRICSLWSREEANDVGAMILFICRHIEISDNYIKYLIEGAYFYRRMLQL